MSSNSLLGVKAGYHKNTGHFTGHKHKKV